MNKKSIFISGPIPPDFISAAIEKHSVKTEIGAHQLFLGQVRKDKVQDNEVSSILYTAHEEMAEKEAHLIREEAFDQFDISCLHIHHSLGEVKAGEICLFVFVSSPHRKAATDACAHLVEMIKSRLPIYGKEVFSNGDHSWKINTYD